MTPFPPLNPLTPSLSIRSLTLIVIAGFFALSALVYGRAVLQSEFVRWDDGMLVYENPAIREISPSTVKYIFSTYDPELYIPLTFLSYQIDYQLGGIQPFQYHLTSFIFHTLNALLVAWFVMLFFKRGKKDSSICGPKARAVLLGGFCGLVFLLHPLHTEAIMWVSGRKDLLSLFFALLTLITWMRWREEPTRRRFILAIILFALALLSKVMAITLPVILVLMDWREGRIGWPFGMGARDGRDGRGTASPLRGWVRKLMDGKIPFFVLSIVFGLIGLGGKTGVVASSTTWAKILMAGKSSLFYLRKIVWPDYFSLLYPYHQTVQVTSPDFYVPIIVWAVLLLLIFLSLRKTRDIAFGMAFYLVTVAPTFLNFTKGGDLDVYFASDRYAYLPSIGVFIAIVSAVSLIIGTGGTGDRDDRPYGDGARRGSYAMGVIACAIIVFLGIRSYQQSFVWQNTFTLFRNVLVYYPETHVAHNNIGNVYRLEGKLPEAIAEYEKALAIRVHPKTLSNLGAAQRKLGQYDKAIATYQQALTLDANSKEAHLGLGIVYAELHKLPQAEAEYRRATEIDPRYEEAFTNLGVVLYAQGKADEAVTAYRQALAINPFFTNAHYNLAIALTQLVQIDEAISEYQLTVRESPVSVAARINLALLLYKTGDQDGARVQFEQILKIDPGNAAAKSALRQMGE